MGLLKLGIHIAFLCLENWKGNKLINLSSFICSSKYTFYIAKLLTHLFSVDSDVGHSDLWSSSSPWRSALSILAILPFPLPCIQKYVVSKTDKNLVIWVAKEFVVFLFLESLHKFVTVALGIHKTSAFLLLFLTRLWEDLYVIRLLLKTKTKQKQKKEGKCLESQSVTADKL